MPGPVLAQELLLGSRRGRQHLFRRLFAGWLVLQLLFYFFIYLVRANVVGAAIFGGEIEVKAAAEFASSYVDRLVWQHLLIMLLLTPALAAGAITDEKGTGTLQYMLAADLTSWEILTGKLAGRVTQIILLSLCALPFFCLIGIWGGINLLAVITLGIVTIAPVFALGSASLLASVFSRRTRDAVLSVYLCGIVGYYLVYFAGIEDWFSPFHVLESAWGVNPNVLELLGRLALSILAWGSVGGICLGLAAWRLRPTYLRQLEGSGRPRRARWWLARRAEVTNEPIQWKERHVEGVAPLNWMRRMPRWLGVTLVAALTTTWSVVLLVSELMLSFSFQEIVQKIGALDLLSLQAVLRPLSAEFAGQAFVALLAATFVIGMRCSGAITGERERQTWEALLMTPLSARALVREKLWGIVRASYPYFVAYLIPALLFSAFAGVWPLVWTVILAFVTWLAASFVGAAGIWSSATARSSWRSLMLTVLIGYVGGFFLFVVVLPVAGLIWLLIGFTLMILDVLSGSGGTFARLGAAGSTWYWISVCVAIIGAFLLATFFFLRRAQRFVADRERVRFWHEEPRRPPRRRLRKAKPATEWVQAAEPDPQET